MYILFDLIWITFMVLVIIKVLRELDIDVARLNPFQWTRKRKWLKKYNADPLFAIKCPMEATAGLIYVMAKCSGDVSKEQKGCMLNLFQTEFKMDEGTAVELLSSCSVLMKDEDIIIDNLKKYMKPSIEKFDSEKKTSALSMIQHVANCEGNISGKQSKFMSQAAPYFRLADAPDQKW